MPGFCSSASSACKFKQKTAVVPLEMKWEQPNWNPAANICSTRDSRDSRTSGHPLGPAPSPTHRNPVLVGTHGKLLHFITQDKQPMGRFLGKFSVSA